MQKAHITISNKDRLSFIREVQQLSGEKIPACYQCGKCTAGCPVVYKMDYTPNQIMRMIQLGMKDEVLNSSAIWYCASCFTCASRCPCGVSLTKIMDALKMMAQKEKVTAKNTTVPLFNKIFLNQVKKYGRVYELGLVLKYNLSTRQFLKDALKGLKMFFRNKLHLFPEKIKDSGLKQIFKTTIKNNTMAKK